MNRGAARGEEPAFPCKDKFDFVYTGLTVRDIFALGALRARWGNGTAMTPQEAAQMAYELADAMLEAR